MIVVISVMSGFDRQLRETLLGFEPHILITDQSSQVLSNYEDVIESVKDTPGIKGAAPLVVGPVLIEIHRNHVLGDPEIYAIYVRGVHPEFEKNVSTIIESIDTNPRKIDGLESSDEILLPREAYPGKDLALTLQLGMGNTVAIHSSGNLQKMRAAIEKEEKVAIFPEDFEIRGIFDVGYYEFNSNVLVMNLWDAQDLFGLGEENKVHGVQLMLEDPMNAIDIRDLVSAKLDSSYHVSTWLERKSGILNAIVVEKNVMFYILFFIMLVAAFGIMGTLIAFVIQKTREIGILKALGAGRVQIMGIFLSQSIFIGVIGVLFGLLLGILMVEIRNDFLQLMNALTGFELFPASIYQFTELPALVVLKDIAIICGGALVMCLIAGIVPAWNAGRFKPVEALRHE